MRLQKTQLVEVLPTPGLRCTSICASMASPSVVEVARSSLPGLTS